MYRVSWFEAPPVSIGWGHARVLLYENMAVSRPRWRRLVRLP